MPAARAAKAPAVKKAAPAKKPASAAARMTLAEAMKALGKAGSEQTRKTYARHGAVEPMFGTSFATIGVLVKKIGVDHDLAMALWDTGNFDARNLAFKVVDPKRMTAADLDRWARETMVRMCAGYIAMLGQESTDPSGTAKRWLASRDLQGAGWGVVGQMAARDESTPDAWFADRLAEIAKTIHSVPDAARMAMNLAVIQIGGRSPALRTAALAAAKKIGKVEVDHGDTSCKTPDAASYIEKMWAHSKAKGFASPSAQERSRACPRTRC
jgi:3-methyladenine DNA glycosylase AlkD